MEGKTMRGKQCVDMTGGLLLLGKHRHFRGEGPFFTLRVLLGFFFFLDNFCR